MTANPKDVTDAALSLVQSGQSGFELGTSNNPFQTYSNSLNLLGLMAGQGPWAVGLNAAASVNNTVGALSNFSRGSLEPSDVLQITGSGLSLAIAAAAVSGIAVTWPLVLTATTISLVAGTGLKEVANEYINDLNSRLVDGLMGGTPVDIPALTKSAGPSLADHYIGPSATVRQYTIGGGELVTVELFSGARISIGEIGHVTGVAAISRVEMNGGSMVYEYGPDGGKAINWWFEPDTSHLASEYSMPIAEAGFNNAESFASNASRAGTAAGNTVDFALDVLSRAGANSAAMRNLLNPGSRSFDYVDHMEWFSHDTDWYNSQNYIDIDGLGDIKLFDFKVLENTLGESVDSASINERVAGGISSPIAIDLNGDGISTYNIHAVDVYFDLTGDGVKERVGWLSESDAFLVRDINGNGHIDGLAEMFGGDRPGLGYANLELLDTNQNKTIDERDAAYSELLLWQDSNVDGVTDKGELTSLATAKVTGLKLDYLLSPRSNNGNLIGETSRATVGEESRLMADVYFKFEEVPTPAAVLTA